ncbi:hypothetical protein [Fibrivirga algicola]|uniref:Uncharacterized protein n=1 Tax=Fibrivirga algicola TaxID=2950420 RepID=A0ABX0QHD2_9BACT|nr:hypothetical protein [Fibrivirga algicola]ARK10326.1 hypothetical protein A6C57_08280 [Fibrella sp. ES10-3-2-2]NID11830.1 hypothetical protein [Fibrivirga algicola]
MERNYIPIKHLKTNSLIFFFLFVSVTSLAQSLGGTSWQGTLASAQNQSLMYPATVTFRVEGTQLTGSVIMESQGVKDLYVLQGMTQGGQAAGTATYPKDGAVFQFEAQLNGAQLAFAVGLNNTPIMTGTLFRLGAGGRAAAPQARTNVPSQQRAATAPSAKRLTSGIAAQLDGLLRGRRLLFMKTGNGLAQKWFYDLCSNGTYIYSDDTSYSSYGGGGDFSAYTRDGGSGTWRVGLEGNVVYLELRPHNGQPSVYGLSPGEQGEIHLQGRRYFLTTNQSCR